MVKKIDHEKFTVYFDPPVLAALRALAKSQKRSTSAQITLILEEGLRRMGLLAADRRSTDEVMRRR